MHAPVADNTLLMKAAEGLMRLVTNASHSLAHNASPERWERFVWTITDHPRLHAHPARIDPARWQHTAVEQAWWRTERQTFIPVPDRTQALFTIAVDVQSLADVLTTPARAAALHAAVASMSPAVLAYRSLSVVREPLLAWLAQQAQLAQLAQPAQRAPAAGP